jgi:ABC-type oligopeptide transport system ATPase subunit
MAEIKGSDKYLLEVKNLKQYFPVRVGLFKKLR